MPLLWDILLIISVLTFWVLNLIGLPGNWFIVGAATIYSGLMPPESRGGLDWTLVGILAGLALLGEVLEFVAGAAGVKKAGGSRGGIILALIGSFVGAMAGLFVGVPVPVVGSVIAAVLFAGLGALGGAMLGESLAGRNWTTSWQIGKAAFWGRLFGTVAKVLIGTILVGVAIAAALFG